MEKQHYYRATIEWTGNRGTGTDSCRSYERSHSINIDGKPVISGSSDAAFRGEKTKHSPEDLLVSALSSCHMLWYLHLCAEAGVIVEEYIDNATGVMEEDHGGGGKFVEVTLNPEVTVREALMIEKAVELHKKAGQLCFIANSVNFPVRSNPVVTVKNGML